MLKAQKLYHIYIAIILSDWVNVHADLKHGGRMCHSYRFVLMFFVIAVGSKL